MPRDPEEERLLKEVQKCALALGAFRKKIARPSRSVLFEEQQKLANEVDQAHANYGRVHAELQAYRKAHPTPFLRFEAGNRS